MVGFMVFRYFDLHFQQFFKPSLKFRPEWHIWFLSSCGALSLVCDIFILGIWIWATVNNVWWAAAPWVSSHTQQFCHPSQQQPPWA
jgi:hypothetical protein